MSASPSLPGPENITRAVLPNGITILTRSNFNSPSVTLSGYLSAGSLFDSDEKLGLADFVTSALMRGTERHTFEQIYDALESVGASLGFSAGTHTAGFSGRALVGVLIPGAALGLIAYGRPPERIPAPERIDVAGFSFWAICVAALLEWEASAFRDSSLSWHPSLTALIDPLIQPHPVRGAAFLVWLLAGWALVRR